MTKVVFGFPESFPQKELELTWTDDGWSRSCIRLVTVRCMLRKSKQNQNNPKL